MGDGCVYVCCVLVQNKLDCSVFFICDDEGHPVVVRVWNTLHTVIVDPCYTHIIKVVFVCCMYEGRYVTHTMSPKETSQPPLSSTLYCLYTVCKNQLEQN